MTQLINFFLKWIDQNIGKNKKCYEKLRKDVTYESNKRKYHRVH